jgi:DNA polymerase elongation subunit (family B)
MYGLVEDKDPEDDDCDDCDYTAEKYRIIDIDYKNNKMVVENKTVNFTESGIKELGKDLKWGLVKDDIKANDIFRLQEGSSADRKIIAEYCIQDCVLVIRLLAKLEIITNSISMANVCHVPLYYLLIRGQGIKSLSLVSKKCRQKQYLIPVLNKDLIDDLSYEGATVFEPKLGFYQNYIPVLDYNSLYPSSIISENISHETIVIDKTYDNLPDYIYYDVHYSNNDGSKSVCRYAKHKDRYGIIPEILQELLSERKATRKLMEKESDLFRRSILDGKQLALKVTANSLYGQLGASTSPICMKELAASTTAVGRKMLELARSFVENDFKNILTEFNDAFIKNDTNKIENLANTYLKDTSKENIEFIRYALGELFEKYNIDPHIIYGDSCTGNTPIILKINDKIKIQQINDFPEDRWISHEKFKNIIGFMKALNSNLINKERPSGIHTDKQQIDLTNENIKIWTHNGWAKVNRVIRHKTDKKIYRVITNSGTVDVTEDHSLLDMNCQEVKPNNCKINDELLHGFPEVNNYRDDSDIDVDEIYLYGLFFKNGYFYNGYMTFEYLDVDIIIKCKNLIKKLYDYDATKDNNKLIIIDENIILKFKSIFYKDYNNVFEYIFNASNSIKLSFINALYDCNVFNFNNINNTYFMYIYDNKLKIQQFYYLLKMTDHKNIIINNNVMIWIKYDDNPEFNIELNKITSIFVVSNKYNDYVYDIETEQGTFLAGIGNMIIKNTDSVFSDMRIKFKENNNLLTDTNGIIHGINLGKLASMFIKKRLPHPHNLEYEKTFHPFCIMSKKRYVGNKYEEDPKKFKQSSMGIVLKRRDNANIVKKVIGGLINIMLNENNIEKALQYIRNSVESLLTGKYPITDFITTKTLRAMYKGTKKTSDSKGKKDEVGTWFWSDVECSQAHVKLCQRIRDRDPGNAPAVNDRIPSIAIFKKKKKGIKMLQGDMIEHPDYIKEKNLEIDYLFYLTNQIMNPAVQFLEHLIKKPNELFDGYIVKENLKRNGNVPLDSFISVNNSESSKDLLELYDKTIVSNRKNKEDNKVECEIIDEEKIKTNKKSKVNKKNDKKDKKDKKDKEDKKNEVNQRLLLKSIYFDDF